MKKLQKLIFTFISITMVMFATQELAFADDMTYKQPPIIPTGALQQTKSGGANPNISTLNLPGQIDSGRALQEKLLPSITKTVIALTGALSLLFVIISGIQILTAYGKEESISSAKKTLAFALVGLLISTLSYAIVQIIISINIGVTPGK